MTLYITRPFHRPDFKISGDAEELFMLLRLQYGAFIGDHPVFDTYDIAIIKQENGCMIKHNGTEIITQTPLYDLDGIFFEKTTYDNSILALHGATVEWQGKAFLFLAATASGKTTLASYLTSSGFGYITDDCILLDRDNFFVYPYNYPIQLRDGGLEVLSKLGKTPCNLHLLDDAVMRRYIYTPVNCVAQPLPLGGIYFIERSETVNMLCDLTSNEKTAELMKAPITHYETTPDYLRLLARLAKYRCNRILYREMDFVADTIRKAGEDIG